MSDVWKKLRPLLPKLIGLIVVPIIFYRLLRPIFEQWESISPFLSQVRWDLLALACGMFALNQFFCRILAWRSILHALGYHLPMNASARIWVSSELARYIPGMVWQVLGRAALAKPYGLPMTTCSVSQVLELTIQLLANVLIAVTTLSLYSSQIPEAKVRVALHIATLLIPLLLAFLHPRVFYPAVNFIFARLGKSRLENQLSFARMAGLLARVIAGQLWLGLAIWLATYSILHVPFAYAWMIPGAYCLAWSAGFCMAAIAPSGIGIRELVLSGTLALLVGSRMGVEMDIPARNALFAAVAVLLRLWAISGELLFATFAYAWDWQGVKGKTPALQESAAPAQSPVL